MHSTDIIIYLNKNDKLDLSQKLFIGPGPVSHSKRGVNLNVHSPPVVKNKIADFF